MIAYVSTVNVIIYMILTMISLCFVFIFILKSRKIWMDKKTNKILIKFEDYFTYIQAHIDSDDQIRIPHSRLNGHERYVMQKKLIEWIEHFKGSHREKLIKLCEDLGLIKLDIVRLHRPLPWIRLGAIYNLGAMRSDQAIPRLMKLLVTPKYEPIVFIIARSIAKCALNIEPLKGMALFLVKQRRNVHHLVVDIIKESELDCTPLMVEFLHDDDNDVIKLGLVGLPAYMVPNVVPTLYRLLHSDDEEIRVQAVKLLSSNNMLIPTGYAMAV
ncbi:HEAT repeat domain-containing protein [Paenibacillus sp. 22594]|uniref:HEAT repeat domain-containing protein n=1 Tax=Paenibacillus sp. 22594 TaxID=3453947 RepID=UPI003F86D190